MIKSKCGVKANVKIELFDENGKLKMVRKVHNAVTTAGKNGVADQVLASPSLAVPTHMELGTGTGGTAKLNLYIANSRQAFSAKTRDGNVVSMVASFAAGIGTGDITEAGIFDSATQDGGNMWNYASFAAIPKGENDVLQFTWTLTVS
jgi:hypothetical protein